MNRALLLLALVGLAAVIAGNLIHDHGWALAATLFGGMLMGFCLGFYLSARTVRETLARHGR